MTAYFSLMGLRRIPLAALIVAVAMISAGVMIISLKSNSLVTDNNAQTPDWPSGAHTKNIMLTGYWNPSGQMIAQFSQDPSLNPDGWKGENWEGRGYNIYSYFSMPGVYVGDFEVDYQKTSEDFWYYVNQIHPVAIMGFGVGSSPWEIEYNARNLGSWVNDNNPPYQPTPSPPDNGKPANHVRHSTLPVQAIADAVNSQTSVSAWVDWDGNPGVYLCEYMAYHGMWYQDIHNSPSDNYRSFAAGFIHVGSGVPLQDAIEATNVTLREVINYLDSVIQ